MNKRPPPAGWLSVGDASKLLGFSHQNLRASYVPHLSPDDIQPGRPALIRVGALIELIVCRQVAERTRQQPQPTGDPLLVEGDSPALERYRLARAKHAELDLALRCGELIEVAKCRDILARWASVLRRGGERIGRMHPEAGRALSESLDECESIVREIGADGTR